MSKETIMAAVVTFVVVVAALYVSAKFLHINSFDEFEEIK